MQMQVIAPCPKKPSSHSGYYYNNYWLNNNENSLDIHADVQDACLELQQILTCSSSSLQQQYYSITRTGNPLVQDSSFIPTNNGTTSSSLHQAVSQLSVSPNNNNAASSASTSTRRPRSYSVGDPPNHYIQLQSPVY